METGDELSERLSGICSAAAVRIAQLLAVHLHERITPSAIDEIRGAVELAVRAAAFEGARGAHETSRAPTSGRLTEPIISKKTRVLNLVKKPPAGAF